MVAIRADKAVARPVDWSGRKYRVLRSLGEDIDMVFGVSHPGEQGEAMRWFLHSHEVDDGGGAIVKILASLGVTMPPKPHKSVPAKPGLLRRLAALRLHLRNSRPVDYAWRAGPKDHEAGDSAAEACFVFYRMPLDVSEQARRHAKAIGVGETAVFMACLDKVCRERWLPAANERVWMMPHDFRRSLGIDTQSGNWTAPVSLRLNADATPEAIQAQLKGLYARGILWGSWLYTNFARWLSDAMIRRAYTRMKSRAWFGVYANMSAWQAPPEDAHKLDGAWIVSAPPVSAVCPITAGSFTWQGRTGFSVQLHASLKANRQVALDVMADWIAEIHRAAAIQAAPRTPQCIAMQALRQQAHRVHA
jgi:hypothetical protein